MPRKALSNDIIQNIIGLYLYFSANLGENDKGMRLGYLPRFNLFRAFVFRID